MRELTQEEVQEVAGSGCTGFFWYLVSGTICCGPSLPEHYTHCYQF